MLWLCLMAFAGASAERAVTWDGQILTPLEIRGDSACDPLRCAARDSLAFQQPADSSDASFLRGAALALSDVGRHREAVSVLETGMKRYGEVPSLRLLEADEFFAAGRYEDALGLDYAMEKRYPESKAHFVAQRARFFRALGMDREARLAEMAAGAGKNPWMWRGWYNFSFEDSRIRYDPVKSRVQELASEVTVGTPAAEVSGNIDTVTDYGRSKVHAAGGTWTLNSGRESLRVSPWLRLNLDADADTLTRWGGGVRLSWVRSFAGGGQLGAAGNLTDLFYARGGHRSDAGLALSWSRASGPGSWSLSVSGSRSASLSQEGAEPVHYQQGNLGVSGSRRLPHGFSLSGAVNFSAFLGPKSVSMDSVARVVGVSGMRDTVLYLSELKSLPSWLTIYDASGNSWSPGFQGIYAVPTTVQSVPFAEQTPSSNAGPSLDGTISWTPHSRLSLFASGSISWRFWLEKTRWNISLLGKNSSGDTITLWHDQETGKWYLMEPQTAQSNDYGRRVLPFETFVRRRQDLYLSGTVGATLDFSRWGAVTASWNCERNWSTIEDKDSDENAWRSQAFSWQWSVSF